jgi:hypothetical protein
MKYKFFTLLLVNLISFNDTACAYIERLCQEWQIDPKKIAVLDSATKSIISTVSTGSALDLKDILKRLEPEVDFSLIGGTVNTLVKMPPSKDNLEKLEILIERGFQVNSLDLKTGQTPLTTIISKGDSIKSIDALLTHPFIDLDKPDRNGLTPLHLATYLGTCPAIVDKLLAHGALYFTHQKSAKDRTTIKNINLDSLVRNNIKYAIRSIIAKHQTKRLENKEFPKTPYSRYLDRMLSNPVIKVNQKKSKK